MIVHVNEKMTNCYKVIIEPDKVVKPDRVISILNTNYDLHLALYYKNGEVKFMDLSGFKHMCFSLKWFIDHQIKEAHFFDTRSYQEHLINQTVRRGGDVCFNYE